MSGEKTPNLSNGFERNALTIPSIFEDDENGRRMGYDIFSRLMKDGVVTLDGPVTSQSAAIIVAQLLHLDASFEPKDKDHMITFYINSPGGSVTAGLTIYDTMMRMKHPVRTVCKGQAASMGSFLLMAGAPGERIVLPNAEVMVHEAAAGKQGKVTDMDHIQAHFNNTNSRLIAAYNFHTGLQQDNLRHIMERKDTFMNAEEALALGLVDRVGYSSSAFEQAFEKAVANDNVEQTNAEPNESLTSDKALAKYNQTFLRTVYDFKKKWVGFTKSYNMEEAKRRGKPIAPAIDDNLLDIGKNRKAPKFG